MFLVVFGLYLEYSQFKIKKNHGYRNIIMIIGNINFFNHFILFVLQHLLLVMEI